MLLLRWSLQVVEMLGKFAAALRQQRPGRVQFIRGLRRAGERRLKYRFLAKLLRASGATSQVRVDLLALLRIDFVARIENEQGSYIRAPR
jgi:hypothetical protein